MKRSIFVVTTLVLLFYHVGVAVCTARILKIGHRGACGYAPENTLGSFAKAIELGVDMIELDVQLCASGELVVIHDETVDRTTNGAGPVAHKSLAELKKFDAGSGQTIPTLQEVFDFVGSRRVKINIELKGPGTARPVIDLIERYVSNHDWCYDDFFISSFDHDQLWLVKQICPSLNIGVLIDECVPIEFATFIKNKTAYSLNPKHPCVTSQLVNACHELGLKVFVYTVNEPELVATLTAAGVDGMFSDYPDRL